MRERVGKLVGSQQFGVFILVVIVANAVIIGVQTLELPAGLERALMVLDQVFLGVYVIEAALKIFAWRGAYFHSAWNLFDFCIVVACLIPTVLPGMPLPLLRTLRVVRIFRVFRLTGAFRPMRIIVEAIVRSLPGVAWTALLLLILFYLFAVTGTVLYGQEFPEYFGNLGDAFFTLFQVMTLEGWTDVSRPIMEVYPFATWYFVIFVVVSAFVVLNVVVGIVVNTIEEAAEAVNAEDAMTPAFLLATEAGAGAGEACAAGAAAGAAGAGVQSGDAAATGAAAGTAAGATCEGSGALDQRSQAELLAAIEGMEQQLAQLKLLVVK